MLIVELNLMGWVIQFAILDSSKRRIWRRVNLAMNAKSGHICAAPMIHQDVGGADILPDLFRQLPSGKFNLCNNAGRRG